MAEAALKRENSGWNGDDKRKQEDLKNALGTGLTAEAQDTVITEIKGLREKTKLLRYNLEITLINFGKPARDYRNETVLASEKEKVQELLKLNKIVLITGPPQSGKTTLIDQVVAQERGGFVRIYVTEQLDTKSLLGNYICGESLGKFEWKEGPLSSVVHKGGLLILENLQEAKEELIELLFDIIEDRFKVRGEKVHVKDSMRVIASYSLGTEESVARLVDLQKRSFELGEFRREKVTLDEILRAHPKVSICPLINETIRAFVAVVEKCSHDTRSELRGNIIEASKFVSRVEDLYVRTFPEEVPIHFSLGFKYLLLHIFQDIYLARLRLPLPSHQLEQISEGIKLTTGEVASYIEAYQPELTITPHSIRSKRYGILASMAGLEGTSMNAKHQPGALLEFFNTSMVGNLVESIVGSCRFGDNMLLVGEAGSGKTTVVQETAKILGRKLHVYNLSQSADVSDLFGGFRPLNAQTYISELAADFITLLRTHFDYTKNLPLVSYLQQLLNNNRHLLALAYIYRETKSIVSMCKERVKTDGKADSKNQAVKSGEPVQKKLRAFTKFETTVENITRMRDRLESSLIFKYIQGNLVQALRLGDWVLLDEINLAQPEVLQNILPILEKKSIILVEKGELKEIRRHPEFKLFGCMNPGNTVGKRELPPPIRKNFIEYYVRELEDPSEIETIIRNKSKLQFQEADYQKITRVYLELRRQVREHQITDGFNRKPTISLRALSRAIEIGLVSQTFYPNQRSRAVVEGLYASLSSSLSPESKILFDGIVRGIFQADVTFLEKAENSSRNIERAGFINIEGFLVKLGTHKIKSMTETDFLMTGSVKKNMTELLRVVAHSNYPVLLEGPTSAGKTSMIKYLGEVSGNKVVRINNHQHTDLDEYIGTYSPDVSGRLVFKEGLLVQAMRLGYWIILDELNLAKSEILEALNRLLDDNRELYIPEINEIVVPHPSFRIFATQNPLDYGGRKELSVAFRSRFFHFFIKDIDDEDLVKIVETRCKVPESRSRKLVDIMKSLRVLRSRQNMFSGKESIITIRDLIKWASREVVDMTQMAINGYCLLAERLRFDSERDQVRKIIVDKCLKGEDQKSFDPDKVYRDYFEASITRFSLSKDLLDTVFWSQSFIRMYSLTQLALDQSEPVLLIGETGSGKTTIADLISRIHGIPLYTVNCHQYSESSDFIGGLRPVRGKETIIASIQTTVELLIQDLEKLNQEIIHRDLIRELKNFQEKLETPERQVCFELCLNESKSLPDKSTSLDHVLKTLETISKLIERLDTMFEWVDGPLVKALLHGGVLLIDEISLAQDSVLERLNSVLERDKSLVLSEKGDGSVEELHAHPKFFVIGTMNPSGDFGKKELTPALRNRFTEVWVEPVTDPRVLSIHQQDIESIDSTSKLATISTIPNDFLHFVLQELKRLNSSALPHSHHPEQALNLLALCLHHLTSNFNNLYSNLLKPLTVRDIKSSLPFFFNVKVGRITLKRLDDYLELVIGGFKCLDEPVASTALADVKRQLRSLLKKVTGKEVIQEDEETGFKGNAGRMEEDEDAFLEDAKSIGIGKYSIDKVIEGHVFEDRKYSVDESVVRDNLKKILMSLTLQKAIMLEGPPGVGKTSLVQFLANKVGIKFYRINLNEQTDMIDLLGSDVPTSSSSLFSWADGVLIQAMKEGSWILLDELNMATQTVLEGLNSVLDHRGSIYLPEIDKTIFKHSGFRLFAAQNPLSMGSGRKGLPHSFLTRFTRVWIEELSRNSMNDIVARVYKDEISGGHMALMVRFFFEVRDLLRKAFGDERRTTKAGHHASGAGQWEFNLRDLHKMVEMFKISREHGHSENLAVEGAVRIIVMDRLDDEKTNGSIRLLYQQIFGQPYLGNFHTLTEGNLVASKYLNSSNSSTLLDTVSEPLLTSLAVIISSKHPVLFLTDSKNDCATTDIHSVLLRLSEVTSKRKVQNISLFSSSDLSDLIGSYEQSNPVIFKQDTAAAELAKNPSSALVIEAYSDKGGIPPLFHWEESELLSSLRRGDWVLIKGAEQVNPAILERLNGVLEEDEIFLNEALGGEEEQILVKKSVHARIFVVFDVGRATLPPSRALRNRCIEINLSNYESSLRHPTSLDQAFQGILKTSTEQTDAAVTDILQCERFILEERIVRSLEIFIQNYRQFISSFEGVHSWDPTRPVLTTTTLKSISSQIQKSLANRKNYHFIASKGEQTHNFSETQNRLAHYTVGPLIASNPQSLISVFLSQFLYPQPTPTSRLIGLSNEDLLSIWSSVAKQLLDSGNKEDLEEDIFRVHSLGRTKMLLSTLTIFATEKLGKVGEKAVREVLKHANLKRVEGLSETMRNVIQSGFVSPVQLCLNVLYNFLLAKSSGFSGIIDRTGDNKVSSLPKQITTSQTSTASDMWTSICSVLSKKTILKYKIVSKAFKGSYLIDQLGPVVSHSLKNKSVVDEKTLSSLLHLISNSISSSFDSLIAAVDSSFISYDFLDEATNLLSHKLIYHAGLDSPVAFLSVLSKQALLELVNPPERIQTIADYLQDNFAFTKSLLNWSEKMNKYAGQEGKERMEYFRLLCGFFCGDEGEIVLRRIALGEAELSRREVKRLGERLGKLEFRETRVCDINLVETMSNMVRVTSPDTKSEAGWGWIDNEETKDAISMNEVNAEKSNPDQDLKILEDICRYAENPNQTTLVSLLNQISKIVEEEDKILISKQKSISDRVFWSVLENLPALKKIHDSLKEIGAVLRSQKTRQITRFQFEGETQNMLIENDQSLSYFLSKTIFRLLSKSSSFLADTDVREMKRLTEYCRQCHSSSDEINQRELYAAQDDSFKLYRSLYKSGFFVTFGDFLLPFFSGLFSLITSFTTPIKVSLESPLSVVGPYYLPLLEALSQRPSSLSPLALSLLLSLSSSLGLVRPAFYLANQLEGHLLLERQRVDKEEALSKGRSFDEASRLRNLQKGIERHVRDEYTKEAVEKNREEAKFELLQIFGSGELAEQLDLGKMKEKVKEWENRIKLKELRQSYLKLMVDGLILTPRGGLVTNTNTDLKKKVTFAAIYFANENDFDFGGLTRRQVLHEYSNIFRVEVHKSISSTGIRDVKKTLMLETTCDHTTVEGFEKFWLKQLQQFIELDENSFYKGNCAQELVELRPVLYSLLGKVQELRKRDELRELPAFNNLISVSDYILSVNLAKVNLGEICLYVERLSGYMLDYESMTPKSMHFPDIKEKIAGFLWEFRQRERRSWRGIVFSQGLDIILTDLEASLEFKTVLESEMAKSDSENHRALLDLVDQYLLKTSLIKHPFRLFFLSRTLASTRPSSLHPLLTHILLYHLTFLPTILQLYHTNFPTVGEPIKENELLSNWHMKDLTNMKMNANKFHKGIHRAMKAHKEILEMGTEIFAYKMKREGYLGNSVEEVINKMKDSKELFEDKKQKAKEDKEAKEKKKASQIEEDQEEDKGKDSKKEEIKVVEVEKPEKKLPVLGKIVIDKIISKPEYKSADILPFVKSNLKLFRIVSTAEWLPLFKQPSKEYAYKNYESAVDQCNIFISDWMQTLAQLKDTNSKSNRLRVADGFLKLLYQMGVRERQSIENWDPVKTFAQNPHPLLQKMIPDPFLIEFMKQNNRMYEMIDMLYVNKSNISYSPDIQLTIRKRMQSYMIYLVSWVVAVSRLAAKVLTTIGQIREHLGLLPELTETTGLTLLTPKERERFMKEYERRDRILKNGWGRGASGEMMTETGKKDEKVLEIMNSFKRGKMSLASLNESLSKHSYSRPFVGLKPETIISNTTKFSVLLTKLQGNLTRDLSGYDLHTKNNFFFQSVPGFFSKVVPRLTPFLDCGCPDKHFAGVEHLSSLLSVLESHTVHGLSALTKFSWISCRVFHSLVYKGLCVKKEEDNDNQEEGSEEYDFGTGIGEGKGDENATDKYDFEEQLLGEKGDAKDEEEKEGEQDDKNNDNPDEGDEKGGEAMDMENDFEGENQEGQEENEKEEKGDEDNEMDEVKEDNIDQDLWDEKNEDMQDEEEKEEDKEKDRRDAEQHEYKGEDKKDEDNEQKAKEPTEKEQRAADDFEAQENKEDEENEGEKEEEKEEDDMKDDDEYAEVESRSSMSERNENDNKDFNEEEGKAEDGEGEEEEKQDEDMEVGEEGELEDDEMNKEDEMDDFDDPLNKEERKIKEEEKEEEQDGEENKEEHEIKESGLNPEIAKEEQDNMNDEKNNDKQTERETKDKAQQNSKNKELKKKQKEQNIVPIPKENAENKDNKEDDEADEKNEKSEKENKQDKDLREQQMVDKAPKERSMPDLSQMDKSRLAELLQNLLADNEESSEEGGELEGLAEGEGAEVRVKQTKQKNWAEEPKMTKKQGEEALEIRREELKEQKADEKEDENEKTEEQMNQEFMADKEKNKGKKEDEEMEEDVDGELPTKQIKRQEEEEDKIEDSNRPRTKEEIAEYLKLLDDEGIVHISASNHSWATIEPQLRTRAYNLCEDLRNILKPTKIAGLKGDFRTGKRLNMRKVISYVASNYRKDKIWLRRSDPSQRDYEIALAIDDTLSMSEKNVGYLALESLITLALALTKLEVGKINISGIRNGIHEVLPFSKPFQSSDGQRILSEFSFQFSDRLSADLGLPQFLTQIQERFSPSSSASTHRILFIVSDGRMNKPLVRPCARSLEEAGILTIYIILDRKEEKGSVLNVRSTSFEMVNGQRKPKIRGYMEDFPFTNYIIIEEVSELVQVLVSVLRDYFSRIE